MKGMTVVLQNDMKDIVRSRQFLIIGIIVGLIAVGVTVGVAIALRMWLRSGIAWEEARPLLELFVGLAVNFVPLVVLFTCMATWATDPVAKEKAKGPIESLLATPLTGKGVWMGKSLAIFMPAYAMALVATLLVLLVMNFAAILPITHHFVVTPPQVLSGFLLLPLLMLAVMSVGVLFSLITNPAAAAYQICRGHRAVVATSTALGLVSAVGGFIASYYLNLPTGACIVLTSTGLFALAAAWRAASARTD